MKGYFLTFSFILSISACKSQAQKLTPYKIQPQKSNSEKTFNKSEVIEYNSSHMNDKLNLRENEIRFFKDNLFIGTQNNRNRTDLFSTVGNNINIGGISGRYVMINFTPHAYLKPAEFMSVYASYNLLQLIPLDELNKYSYKLVMQNFFVILTDISLSYFIKKKTWISELTGFACKNLIINFAVKPFVKSENRKLMPWINDESYFYSVSFDF